MDNSKAEKKAKNKKDESQDKKKKIQKSLTVSKKIKLHAFKNLPEMKNEEIIENKPNDICSICGQKNTKLFDMKCSSNHYLCFKCLYDFFLTNICDILNESKNNKKEILIKCPECYNKDNSGGLEIKNEELLNLIKENMERGVQKL